jgi:16S rRNA (cytidine1402-2'-O)-methyltransferase
LKTGQKQIFIETPYRNATLLQALLQTLQGNTRLAVSCGLTLDNAWSKSATVAKWKQDKPAPPLGLPTVFCIGR